MYMYAAIWLHQFLRHNTFVFHIIYKNAFFVLKYKSKNKERCVAFLSLFLLFSKDKLPNVYDHTANLHGFL